MIDPLRDLAALHDATERLLSEVSSLNNAHLLEPSRLPGWSRGHVLAHLSRNADALVNVLEGRPMYESAEARDRDIARDAPRPLADQLADLRDSAARVRAVGALPADWNRRVALRNGVTDSASRVPFRRLVEVELHHVDLDIGYELEKLPAEFTAREIAFLTERFSGHPDIPPVRVVSADDGSEWSTGGTAGEPVTVGGPSPVLLGWLAGRRAGAELAELTVHTNTAGAGLPALPPL
ncbi:maleylpyruvate isomerase family mycothiol-dependent enzyme [Streptomyces albipurpureus]|uniref:Maleylpyruvate isomerase family mycothiol-dependent enzyme n=1 Tax=Streptomyces albipurpureus TaxID=2897419 RepID=A0ABT0UTC0_9ACTN|nr:maleylpyruvate isomerase family mycothiol-dependent enzyme [Streptomyces sp. CWNU-1]MCM2390850.1 maleylpyruvate isomerase family mycothiol-dependent enzyme [Streptomyces sp. CWNU-1]